MNRLPIEILPFIIQHLDNDDNDDHHPRRRDDLLTCTLVNRQFYTATIPILWRVYSDHKHRYQQSPSRILNLIQSTNTTRLHPLMAYLRQVKLYKTWTDTDLIRLMTCVNPHVDVLYIVHTYYDLTDQSLHLLPQYWPHLTVIHLCGVSVTRKTTTAIARYCHQLVCFRLIKCRSLTSDMFAPFVESNQRRRRLTELSLWTDFEDPWNEQTLMDLSHLPITRFSFQGSSSSIFMDALLASPWWPQLTSIVLGRIGHVDTHLVPFLKSHPMLKTIELEDCNGMTNATLDAMAMYLPYLQSVHVDGTATVQWTGQGVIRLVRHCIHLDWFILERCDMTLDAFPEGCIDEYDKMAFDQAGMLRLSLDSILAIRQINTVS